MVVESGVVILAPSNSSAYSLSVLKLLLDKSIPVQGVVIQKLIDRKRIQRELKYSWQSLLSKIFRKLIFQRLGIGSRFEDGFTEFYRTLYAKRTSLTTVCEQNSIPYRYTNDFHNSGTLKFIQEVNCNFAVFTGGGIIRKELIDSVKGILNCHMGFLPKYRGMDCTYWCFLNNDYKSVGYTVHLMDYGVDTGPILKAYKLDVRGMKAADDVVRHIEYQMASALVEAVLLVESGDAKFTIQISNQGRQYYAISPECLDLARKNFLDRNQIYK